MVLTEKAGLEYDWERLIRVSFAPRVFAKKVLKHCAYNHSRECFLGLDIATADLSSSGLTEELKSLLLHSGKGLWITPFCRDFVPELPAAIDLIFLDSDFRVLETVESVPAGSADLSELKATSVLALPVHSIYTSQTQVGDQLVVCVAEEMERRLEELAVGLGTVSIKSAALLREQPLWSDSPGVLQFESPAPVTDRGSELRHEMDLVKPEAAQFSAPTNWLERWWSPDPRRAPRQPARGLAAYYWNGGAPEAHGIRDISKSGIYIVTEERWYPGSLVLMTLQRTECGEEIKEKSIAVTTRAVRWGHDGVGLQFALPKRGEIFSPKSKSWRVATQRELDRFVRQLKTDE